MRGKPFEPGQIANPDASCTIRGNGCLIAPKVFEPVGCQLIHSITSSARASSVGGTSSPSACAVIKLMTSSNFGQQLPVRSKRYIVGASATSLLNSSGV
jgi:hypothetical protein